MRLSLSCSLLCVLFVLLFFVAVANADVSIPDRGLEGAIQDVVGHGNPFTVAELESITFLDAYKRGITDLTGLEYCTSLMFLYLGVNIIISDVSPLSGLTSLMFLVLDHNNISNISPLSGLTSLTWLLLHTNNISDIQPLVDSVGLSIGDYVNLYDNPLSYKAIYTDIPILQDRGVIIDFDNRTPTTLSIVSGDLQTGNLGAELPDPFVVLVEDQDGDPFEAVPVTFGVKVGGGSLSVENTETDANGQAQSTLTLGIAPGLNTVDVTAEDITTTVTFCATALNQAPVAEAGADQEVFLGETANFDGSGSYDPDDPLDSIVSYKWDFGDGTPTESGEYVSHICLVPGVHTVTLMVTDSYDETGTDTATLTVLTSAEAVEMLMQDVGNLGLPQGMENSLLSMLEAAINAMDRGNYDAALGQLMAFINELTAQSGKSIPPGDADDLIALAERIIASIGAI